MTLPGEDAGSRARADTLPMGVRPFEDAPEDTAVMPDRIAREPHGTAADLAQRAPHVVHMRAPMSELRRMIRGEGCGAVPVIDLERRLRGLVTEHELVLHGYSRQKPRSAITARDLMEMHPHHVQLDDSLEQVVRMMERHHLHWVPVVDRDHRVAGLISREDVAHRAEHDAGMRDLIAHVADRRSLWRRFWH